MKVEEEKRERDDGSEPGAEPQPRVRTCGSDVTFIDRAEDSQLKWRRIISSRRGELEISTYCEHCGVRLKLSQLLI